MNFFRKQNKDQTVDPDEVLIDSSNLPGLDTDQFEGRLEKPISRKVFLGAGFVFAAVGLIFLFRLGDLQIIQDKTFASRSESNSLRDSVVFAQRAVIYDRNGVLLAWNEPNPNDPDVPLREYATTTGLYDLIGYVKYPSKDSSGFYYREDYLGMDGIEKYYNDTLEGQNGTQITETDAYGNIVSQSVMDLPVNGQNITLSIDSRLESAMYNAIQTTALSNHFTGGAGIMIDIHTGEVIADVSYPEYSSQVMTDGTDTAQINSYLNDPNTPLLDRASAGLYTPGSIIKPVMALGALDTGVIAPDTVIDTHGYITVPNPYDPAHPSIFRDWQNNGPLDMEKAIQESSDAYFYEVGGGYGSQPGMGIANIDKYANMFGYGQATGGFFGNSAGTVPSPEWKAANFNGAQWLLGDTYHSVIGQYGWQVTPVQVARAIAAVANNGTLVTPTILAQGQNAANAESTPKSFVHINIPMSDFDVVHQGMRLSAEMGTGDALNITSVEFAAKTGTAQLGPNNAFYNSWVAGFFPYQNPRYAFAIVMEHGLAGNLIGAPFVSRQFFDWVIANAPEYTTIPTSTPMDEAPEPTPQPLFDNN